MIIAERTKLHALEQRAADLKQRIGTLKWQIDEMANFYSADQVRAWRKLKRSLTLQLNKVEQNINDLKTKINASIPRRTH